jgi:hypothetical protein
MRILSGLDLDNPKEMLFTYVCREYDVYDGIHVKNDFILRPEEIAISMLMNSRISGNTARAIWTQRNSVERGLKNISSNVAITDDENQIPWNHIATALDGICYVPRAKLAVASKILHKKRPALILMMDSVITEYYDSSHSIRRNISWGEIGVEIMKAFRQDVLSVKEYLESLACELKRINKPLSLCRILEILIWVKLERTGYYRNQ